MSIEEAEEVMSTIEDGYITKDFKEEQDDVYEAVDTSLDGEDDPEIEAIKARVKVMEEVNGLKMSIEQAEEVMNTIEDGYITKDFKEEQDVDEAVDTSLDGEEEDPEIEAIKARVKEMEEEANKLKEMQKAAEETLASPTHSLLTSPLSGNDKVDTDSRSVFVGNVDYSATATDVEQHFHGCGAVNRVTILCDKFTGNPKGFAYVEFTEKDSVDTACQLTDSLFKGRQVKVTAKRTNLPGLSSTNRFPRSRGRGRGRGFYAGGGYSSGYRGGYAGYSPRGRGFRSRGGFRSRRAQSWYSPY